MIRKNYLLLILAIGLVGLFSLAAPQNEGQTKVFTSTNGTGHTHSFTLSKADIDNPPAEGISKATSTDSGHNHQVTLTKERLMNLKKGMKVTIKTSVDAGHDHEFTFSKWD
jgi:hypothetical protein